ncbi:MAG: hypothetical protein ACKN89_03185 [Cyanobium sp.]
MLVSSSALFPDTEMEIPHEDLEWIMRLALESRRRVKEPPKRCLKERVPQHPLQLHPWLTDKKSRSLARE